MFEFILEFLNQMWDGYMSYTRAADLCFCENKLR